MSPALRAFALVVAAVLVATGVGIAAEAPGSAAGGLAEGAITSLELAGSLAVGANGTLYVAAPSQHQILVRLTDGRFRVVAGDGRSGFTGDNGRAVDAELSNPSELTFGPGGALYFVDGGRVRVVHSDGIIETIAGNGIGATATPGSRSPTVANGTPALAASLGSSPSIALGAGGELYLDTSTQLLRLMSSGRLETLPIRHMSFYGRSIPPGVFARNLGPMAVDGRGDVYIAGFNGWQLWRVAAHGDAIYVGYDRGSGGSVPDLVRGPDGAIYAANGSAIDLLSGRTMKLVDDLTNAVRGRWFWLTDFAFGPSGVLYADELPGSEGFEQLQQLIELRGGHASVLWKEPQVIAKARQ